MSQSRPQPPLCYRLVRDASGQSETFGVLLLLGITVIGTVAIVAFGSQAMTDIENSANLQRTEHTMTLLDSRSAMVALGDSEQQAVDFSGTGDGSFTVKEDAGWINITHENFSADESGDEVIYNRSLGTFLYENGETTIAYQGGGVWRIDEDGDARMVSQPEFLYESSTLTLPIIRVRGEGEATGQTTVNVKQGERTRIYPNTSIVDPPGNETGAPYNNSAGNPPKKYENPIRSGNVTIRIHSEYYQGWANYFRTRTSAEVAEYDSNETVRIMLKPLGDPGAFGNFNQDISVRGMPEAHATSNFTVNLTESSTGNSFKQMEWSWYAEDGSEALELYYNTDGAKCSDVKSDSSDVLLHIIYKNGTGTNGDQTQEWVTKASENDDIIEDVNCSSDSKSIVVNWTAGNTDFTYKQIPSGQRNCASGGGSDPSHEFGDELSGCSNGEGPGSVVFDQHDADAGEPNCTSTDPCDTTENELVNSSFLVNHYFALMGPSYDLEGGEHSNDKLDEDSSSGGLYFDQKGGKYVQYLHITENEIHFDSE